MSPDIILKRKYGTYVSFQETYFIEPRKSFHFPLIYECKTYLGSTITNSLVYNVNVNDRIINRLKTKNYEFETTKSNMYLPNIVSNCCS